MINLQLEIMWLLCLDGELRPSLKENSCSNLIPIFTLTRSYQLLLVFWECLGELVVHNYVTGSVNDLTYSNTVFMCGEIQGNV